MLSVQPWLRTCRLQIVGVQRVHVSAKICSKDSSSSSSSDSESDTKTQKTKNQVGKLNDSKTTTQPKPPITNTNEKQAKPFIENVTGIERKPFIHSIVKKRGTPFINTQPGRQGRPFIDNITETRFKPFIDGKFEKQEKPFIDSIRQQQPKQFIDSKTGKEGKPFIESINEEQAKEHINSIKKRQPKPFIDSKTGKQAIPFIHSVDAQQAKQNKDQSRQWGQSRRWSEEMALREKQQQPNVPSVTDQVLRNKAFVAAEAIASKFGTRKESVTSELMSKFGTDKQNFRDSSRFTGQQQDDEALVQNENSVDMEDDSWSYKLTTARTFVERERVPFTHYTGDKLRSGRTIRFVHAETFSALQHEPELRTWQAESEKHMRYLTRHIPRNAFEEMIQWTEKGLLWKFPIDNEQGMDLEPDVHFSEHVFLDRHLKYWCPKHGPVRHFMDLVCIGLSKNPYMTVREKISNILWYRDYFAEKSDLLLEVGAITTRIPKTTLELTE